MKSTIHPFYNSAFSSFDFASLYITPILHYSITPILHYPGSEAEVPPLADFAVLRENKISRQSGFTARSTGSAYEKNGRGGLLKAVRCPLDACQMVIR